MTVSFFVLLQEMCSPSDSSGSPAVGTMKGTSSTISTTASAQGNPNTNIPLTQIMQPQLQVTQFQPQVMQYPATTSVPLIPQPTSSTKPDTMTTMVAGQQQVLQGDVTTVSITTTDELRKMAWSQGHPDYMGTDKFENIQAKLDSIIKK